MSQPIAPPPLTWRRVVRAAVTSILELAGLALIVVSTYRLRPELAGVIVGLGLVAVGYTSSRL